MRLLNGIVTARAPIARLAWITIAVGVGGMGVSFLFLASNHQLDVLAGAAGFIAGAFLAGSGLVSTSIVSLQRFQSGPPTTRESKDMGEPGLDVARWTEHFRTNQLNRAEPEWASPITLPASVVEQLVRSLEQFQLGDGGGPAYLIAHNREQFLSDGEGTRGLVDLWFAEEREHARLLSAAVTRFGGHCIRSHWSFTAFCMIRKCFGVRFELTVLLLTEIVSTVYYRLMLRHGEDAALRSMCRLILRDENGHVSFHRDRLARQARDRGSCFGKLWAARFRSLGLGAATMLWVNHSAGLKALGATRREFYREVWRELSGFILRLRTEALTSDLGESLRLTGDD